MVKNVSNLKRDDDVDSNEYKYNRTQQTGTQQQQQPQVPQPATISATTPPPPPRMPLNPVILNPSQQHHHHRHHHHHHHNNKTVITNQDQEQDQENLQVSFSSSFGCPNYFEPKSILKPTPKSKSKPKSKSGPSYPYSASADNNIANINEKGLGPPSPTTASFISAPSTATEEEGQGEVPHTELLQHPSLRMGTEMEQHQHHNVQVTNSLSKEPEKYNQTVKQSLARACLSVFWPDDCREELRDARLLTEAMGSEHMCLTKELLFLQEENQRQKEFPSKTFMAERQSVLGLENNHPFINGGSEDEIKGLVVRGGTSNMPRKDLQAMLEKMTKGLEESKLLSSQYQEDLAGPHLSWWKQDKQELIKIVLNLQEEISALKYEFLEKLCCKNEENMKMKMEWERATLELTSFLLDGSKSLADASGQIESIACSFSQENSLVGDQVERAAKVCIEKDKTILALQKSLEDAQKMVAEMEFKLSSLKGATIAFTEVGQLPKNEHFINSSEPANNSLEHAAEMKHHPLMLGTNQVLRPHESRMWETEVDCSIVRGLDDDGKNSQPDNLLTIYEEARETLKAADLTSNTSLNAHENVKWLSCMWKQAGEEWMKEKASLIKEAEQHKSSVNMLERENAKLLDQTCSVVEEMTNSISLLEVSFLQMQKDVEERFREMYSDTLSTGLDILHCICISKSSVENISTDIMEKDIASLVLYHCFIDEMVCKHNTLNNSPRVLQCGKCKCHSIMNSLQGNDMCGDDGYKVGVAKSNEAAHLGSMVTQFEGDNGHMHENLFLKKELERKEFLLKGLLFDFSLLQEAASNAKDINDETENLRELLSQAQGEIETKTKQLNDILLQHEGLKVHLADNEIALLNSESNLHQSKESIDSLSNQVSEWRVILKDMYVKKFEAEEHLEEQKEIVKGLEKEILHLSSSVEKIILSSVEDLKIDLERVINERNKLQEEIGVMGDKLDLANALVDEKEAIAVEARQESKYSKLYAEQKEEEVKVLERSVEVLEFTINVLEKKVSEMDDEVKEHLLARDSLESETQALRQRMLLVENFTENMDPKNVVGEQTDHQISWNLPINVLELDKTHKQIRVLEEERTEHIKEIKQLKEYISELLMHTEAQASQYQQKYKILEALFREIKPDLSSSTITTSTLEKPEKSSTRKRGSSSPFRCLASLVQQMNLENNQELSLARLHIEELKSFVASQQKQVCMLTARLAATESMAHDVIRDLLGVKLDLTNYANMIDQHDVQNLLEAAQQQTKEFLLKEQEIHKLWRQNKDLTEEKEIFIFEMKNKAANVLDAEVTIGELHQRDEYLTTQNDMLKIDKTNLLRRVAEQDEIVKRLLEQNTQEQMNRSSKIKEHKFSVANDMDFPKRFTFSEKLLPHVNDELAWYASSSIDPCDKVMDMI